MEPWLKLVKGHTKRDEMDSAMDSMPHKETFYMTSQDSVVMNRQHDAPRKCINLVANLDHFKFRSWLSEKCVCIYTLEAITSRIYVPKRSHHRVSIMAGKKMHKLDCVFSTFILEFAMVLVF